tara:strand:+ start:403 stop:609 length:207 start_codon:yes stop_codon:yes gene_type:complete
MKDLLADLHNEVALDLLRRVQSGEATSQELSVAVKFLKDNNIEAQMTENSPLANLVDSLPVFDDEKLH